MITVTSRVMKNCFYTAYIVCSEIRLKKIMTWAIFREELIKYLCFNFTSIFFKKTMISMLTFIFFSPTYFKFIIYWLGIKGLYCTAELGCQGKN